MQPPEQQVFPEKHGQSSQQLDCVSPQPHVPSPQELIQLPLEHFCLLFSGWHVPEE